jgi:hypothetical protein
MSPFQCHFRRRDKPGESPNQLATSSLLPLPQTLTITILIRQRALQQVKGGYLRIGGVVLRSWISFAITALIVPKKSNYREKR